MTNEELEARVRASRNLSDWPDAPLPDEPPAVAERSAAEPPEIEPEARAQRIGLGIIAACCLPWIPLLWWIFTR